MDAVTAPPGDGQAQTTGGTTGSAPGNATVTPKRDPIPYAVYRATGDDVKKEGIASQLNHISTQVAHTELEARWKAVDASEELTGIVNGINGEVAEHAVVFLVAIPESRVGTKRTTIDRKTSERRI